MRLYRVPPSTPEEQKLMDEKIRGTEVAISWVLRIGVTVSVLIFFIGLVITFVHHPQYARWFGVSSYHPLTSSSSHFPHTIGGMVRGIEKGSGAAITVLGTALLILTPVARVAVAVFSFIFEKDPAMTIVTCFVLFVLILSFALAGI